MTWYYKLRISSGLGLACPRWPKYYDLDAKSTAALVTRSIIRRVRYEEAAARSTSFVVASTDRCRSVSPECLENMSFEQCLGTTVEAARS